MGTHGNEGTDKLVMKPTTQALSTQFEQIRSNHKAYIKKNLQGKSKRKWTQERPNNLLQIKYNGFMLPNTLCENIQWKRCLTRLKIGHNKLTHGHFLSWE